MENYPDLSERQIQILKHIVEEYIETAQAVGSKVIENKYQLGISPATIRNEMAKLIKLGYLKQPHTSAGRVPTPRALKYYINNLMKPRSLSVSEEVAVKEKVWEVRRNLDKLLREATRALAESTNALAVTTTNEHDMYFSGTGNILEMPEFANLSLAHSMFEMLDRADWWEDIFERTYAYSSPYYVLLGNEWGLDELYECGYVFAPFRVGGKVKGSIGVVGPLRLNYQYIIPTVEYLSNLISEMAE